MRVKNIMCNRLLAHQDDADIDDPYTPPQGNTLGQGIDTPLQCDTYTAAYDSVTPYSSV